MRAGCNHAALIQDKNAVCFLHGRQTMRHNQGRTVAGQFIHCQLYCPFAFRIQRAGGFIQQKHRGIAQNSARYRNPLLLPTRQQNPALSHISVKTLR